MKSTAPSKNLPNSGGKSGAGPANIARRVGRPLGAVDRHGRCVPVRDLSHPTWRALCQAFGHRLDDLMTERDVAATELAAATGLHLGSINAWRRGARMPNTHTLAMLAGALGCALVDLLPEQAHAAGGVS
jgi:DNA-binding Xre family transcriptional regulator